MRRVHSALGRSESSRKHEEREPNTQAMSCHQIDAEAWHAAQAGLWTLLGEWGRFELTIGSETLSALHEDMVGHGSSVHADARLSVMLNRAERVSTVRTR
jgi:hypothetical protein